jgi:putative flavoprotein involved in K+ transport
VNDEHRAKPPRDDETREELVVVVGAGAAGLAVAAALRSRGIDGLILEREREIALPWERRYESLRLNTPRGLSHLPRYRMPRRYGRWPGRASVVEYLREYRRKLGLRVAFSSEVRRVDHAEDGWLISQLDGGIRARCVVIATGHDAYAAIPPWPGAKDFRVR